MIDSPARKVLDPTLDRVGARLHRLGVRAGHVTLIGLLFGIAAAFAAATEHWLLALALWLANRVLDGLDGPVARVGTPTPLGGYLDFVADYVVYVSIPLAIGYATPSARLALACMFAAFLVNIVQLLTLSTVAEQRHEERADGRSIHFGRGLVEGGETIIAYTVALALPAHARMIFLVFGALVLVTAAQRFREALRILR